jgi:hypothetical protein
MRSFCFAPGLRRRRVADATEFIAFDLIVNPLQNIILRFG